MQNYCLFQNIVLSFLIFNVFSQKVQVMKTLLTIQFERIQKRIIIVIMLAADSHTG